MGVEFPRSVNTHLASVNAHLRPSLSLTGMHPVGGEGNVPRFGASLPSAPGTGHRSTIGYFSKETDVGPSKLPQQSTDQRLREHFPKIFGDDSLPYDLRARLSEAILSLEKNSSVHIRDVMAVEALYGDRLPPQGWLGEILKKIVPTFEAQTEADLPVLQAAYAVLCRGLEGEVKPKISSRTVTLRYTGQPPMIINVSYPQEKIPDPASRASAAIYEGYEKGIFLNPKHLPDLRDAGLDSRKLGRAFLNGMVAVELLTAEDLNSREPGDHFSELVLEDVPVAIAEDMARGHFSVRRLIGLLELPSVGLRGRLPMFCRALLCAFDASLLGFEHITSSYLAAMPARSDVLQHLETLRALADHNGLGPGIRTDILSAIGMCHKYLNPGEFTGGGLFTPMPG